MKKLLLGSVVLTMFTISIILFQISCKKDSIAQQTNYTLPPATSSTLGGIIVGNGLNITSNGTLSVTSGGGLQQLGKVLIFDGQTFATINYDGSNKVTIPINLPSGRSFRGSTPKGSLSPDCTKLFFEAYENIGGSWNYYIYTCSINGSNLSVISTSTNPASGLMDSY